MSQDVDRRNDKTTGKGKRKKNEERNAEKWIVRTI